MVVLKHLNDVETAMRKGKEICGAFRDYLGEEAFPVSCSAGIALCGEELSAELIEHADQALYRAKREKKGCCFLWDEQ